MKMIALVSDQRMQNIIPVLQKGADYTVLTLVLSKDRVSQNPLDKYTSSARDLKATLSSSLTVKISDRYVDPYEISHVREIMTALIEESGGREQVIVNISGGTKPMAIGALQAAQSKGTTSLYTNTEDGEIIWILSGGGIDKIPIQVEGLDVTTYIRAYGEEIESSKRINDLDPRQITWSKIIAEHYEIIYEQVINPINRTIKNAYKTKQDFPLICKISPTRRQQEVIQRLSDENLWNWDDNSGEIAVPDKDKARFLNGGWVEMYSGFQMKDCGCFDEALLNVRLKGIEGELDLVGISNGKLVLIECKSNVQRSEQLNKLDAFRRRLGGPFAKAYYARASNAYHRQIQQQCNKLGLDGVFFGAELREMGRKIGTSLGVIS